MSTPIQLTQRIVSSRPSRRAAERHGSCSGASGARIRRRWTDGTHQSGGCDVGSKRSSEPGSAPTAFDLSAIGDWPEWYANVQC